jgi:hypothetical protein
MSFITIGANEDLSKEDVKARVLAVGVGLFFALLVDGGFIVGEFCSTGLWSICPT